MMFFSAKDQQMDFEQSNMLLNVGMDNSQLTSSILKKTEAEPAAPAASFDKVRDFSRTRIKI